MSPRAARSYLIAIIAGCCAVYLIGNNRVPLWDRDEPRYAQTSRQMLQSGDWVVPRLLDEVRTAKPVFIYWCQACAMKAFGDNAFAARLPSVIAITLLLTVCAVVIARQVDYDHAIWMTLVLGTSGLIIAWSARNALTDGVLLLWITIAHFCVYRIWSTRHASWPVVIALAASIGLAGLTKGPVILGVLVTTLIALAFLRVFLREGEAPAEPRSPETRLGGSLALPSITLKVLVALVIIAIIVGPWVLLIQQRAPAFLQTTAKHDLMQRIFEPLEQHSGPPGYYLLTIWGTFFPWSLLLPLAFIVAFRDRHDPWVRYALAAVVGPWLMFELIRTKLPHYVLPAFPPLGFLLAHAIVRARESDFTSRGFKVALAVWALVSVGFGIAPWMASRRLGPIPTFPAAAWSAVALVYVRLVCMLFIRRRPRAGLATLGGGMVVAMIIAFAWLFPSLWFLQMNVRIAGILRADGATIPGQVQMIGYKEPSLAFYQGGTIREQTENLFLATHPPEQWPKWIVIRRDIYESMPQRVQASLQEVGRARGWDYAERGKVVDVLVLRKR